MGGELVEESYGLPGQNISCWEMSMDLELRGAFRSLTRSPGYFVTVVLSLALGLGAAAAAFGVIDAVRLRALPFPDGDRLVVLSEVPAKGPAECRNSCDVSYETYANVLRANPPRVLDALAAYTAGGKTLGTSGEPLLVLGGIVSPNVFPLLQARPALGRGLSEADDRLGVPLVTVLSHALGPRSGAGGTARCLCAGAPRRAG
jgi:putative ABC transport system permease protein